MKPWSTLIFHSSCQTLVAKKASKQGGNLCLFFSFIWGFNQCVKKLLPQEKKRVCCPRLCWTKGLLFSGQRASELSSLWVPLKGRDLRRRKKRVSYLHEHQPAFCQRLWIGFLSKSGMQRNDRHASRLKNSSPIFYSCTKNGEGTFFLSSDCL